jgi:hypothetical protein
MAILYKVQLSQAKTSFFDTTYPGWYDLTSYVRSVDFTRGRSRWLDDYSAGTCSIVLDNRTRAFDPLYSSGTFYGQVKPGRGIRIFAWDDTTSDVESNYKPLFAGYTDTWSFEYDINGDSTCTLQVFDLMQLLSSVTLSQDFNQHRAGWTIGAVLGYPNLEIAYNQTWYSTLSDRSLITEGNSDLSAFRAENSGMDTIRTVAQSDNSEFYIDRKGQPQYRFLSWPSTLTCVDKWEWNFAVEPVPISGQPWTYRDTISTIGGKTAAKSLLDPPNTPKTMVKYYDDGYEVFYKVRQFVTGFKLYAASASAKTYTINIVLTDTNGTQTTYTETQSITSNSAWIQVWSPVTNVPRVNPDGVKIELTISEPTGQIFYITDLGFFPTKPAAWFDGNTVSTSTVLYGFDNDLGEYGTSFAVNLSTQSVPVQTLTIADDGTGIPYTGISVVSGTENLYNRVENIEETGRFALNDTTSQASYGVRTYTMPGLLSPDTPTLAANFLASQAQPEYRIETVTFAVHSLSTANKILVMNMDIYDKVTLKFTPNKVGSAITNNSYIIGVSQTITPETHDVTWMLANQP